ncbi:MAG: aldo/keto reductase [Planctomycetota bacterium]
MGKHLPTRRDFIKQTAYGLCAGNMISHALAASSRAEIPTRPLGSTGVNVSILGLGGHHIGRIRDDNQSIRLIRKGIDIGVTFLDNAWEYHNGRSEELMGKALTGGYRGKAFLMTKHHGRDKKTAMEHLEDSLRRLRTDVIDLWQFHEVVYDKDPEMIFAVGGGIEAAELAKKQGKVRFIGFTGHRDPVIHLKMLAYGYPWDAVQMPMNVEECVAHTCQAKHRHNRHENTCQWICAPGRRSHTRTGIGLHMDPAGFYYRLGDGFRATPKSQRRICTNL